MNQKFASYLALIFILGLGVFNMSFAIDNLWKRKSQKNILYLRFVAGFITACGAIAFGYYFIWTKS